MRRVSRNLHPLKKPDVDNVTPRMRRVSRNNMSIDELVEKSGVTPRMRRVSRNLSRLSEPGAKLSHASHEACE